MDWGYPRSIYGTVVMCEAAARHGLGAARCLEGSGIRAQDLERPAATVRADQELAVARNIVQALDHVPGLGLEVGALFHISAYGVLAFAMASCANVRELIEIGVQYSSLAFSIAHKRFEVADGEVRVYIEDGHVPEELRRVLIERDLAAFQNIHVELFSRACRRSAWSCAMRRRPMPRCTANASAWSRASARRTTCWPRAPASSICPCRKPIPMPGVAGKVRAMLQTRPERPMDMDEIAACLHTTARNLRRQLDAEGTSYRGLVEELRQTLAEKLLLHGQLSVEQIASRVGYQEPASFTSAFKRWKGVSPRAWREAQGAAAR